MLAVGCGDSSSSLFSFYALSQNFVWHMICSVSALPNALPGFFLEATLGPHMVGTLLRFSLGYRFFSQVFLKNVIL